MWSVLEKEKVPFPFQGCIYLSDRMVYSQPIRITSSWVTAVIGGVLMFEKQDVSFRSHHCIEFALSFFFKTLQDTAALKVRVSYVKCQTWQQQLGAAACTFPASQQVFVSSGECVWGSLDRGSKLPPTGLNQQNIFKVLGCVRHFSHIKCQLFAEY